MKKLCMAKPVVLCSDGSMSPTNALKGSIEIFIDASMIQSIPAAIQSTGEFGIIRRQAKPEWLLQESMAAVAKPVPCIVAHMPDYRLNYQPGNRGGNPQYRNIVNLCSKGFKNPADICILKSKSKLDSKKSKTHVPDLPEG